MSQSPETWTVDDFNPFVQEVLNKWKRGDLFMEIGLDEKQSILKEGESAPNKDDKEHKYNQILDLIIKDITAAFKLEKKQRKLMIVQLRNFSADWEAMIREKSVTSNSPVKVGKSTKQESEDQVQEPSSAVDRTKKKEIEGEEETTETSEHEIRETQGDLTAKQIAKKAEFEKQKEGILNKLPKEVKDRFGQQYFSKWAKNSLPCLVLSPFNVPPGSVRDMWFDMYEKVNKQDRLSSATNLVYWYGSYDDPANAYSFVVSSKLIPYASGEKKGFGEVPKATQKKIDGGKKLTASETMLVQGLEEMKQDTTKAPDERHGRMSVAFLEEWEYLDQEVVEEEPQEETQKRKSKPKGKGKKLKRKKSDDDNLETQKHKKIKKEGESKKTNMKESPKRAKKEEAAKVTTKVEDIEDIGDDDISSHDDKDDLEDAEPSSESDEDDEDYEAAKQKKTKKKAASAKAAPKKKTQKSKPKIQKGRKEKKKVPEGVRKRKQEQHKFQVCESNYLVIINEWKYGLENHSKGALSAVYTRLLDNVSKFTAPFIEAYEMPALMKRSKKILDNDNRLKLWNAMKTVYQTKKKDVPAGFVPEKQTPKAQAPRKEAAKKSDPEDNGENDSSRTGTKIQVKTKVERQDSSCAPAKPATPAVPAEKKKKFSLGSMMTRPKPTTKTTAKSELTHSTSATQLSKRQDNPAWMSETSIKDVPTDENRSFALEFLQQATPFIPPNDKVNSDVIARELEASIFEWAGGKEGVAVTDCFVKYWDKVDDMVAAISGDGGNGTIARMISLGIFRSASDVVQLSENDIACSFEGRPLEDFRIS